MSGREEGEGESEIQSISRIVSFLKSAFRDADYEKAERMLKLREEKLISSNKVLEMELKKMMEQLVEAEEELQNSQTKCSQLKIELEKKKNNKDYYDIIKEQGELEFQNTSLSEEVNVYKRRCDALNEQIARLEKGKQHISESESEAEEINVAYAKLERENKELALAKINGETEIEAWKKRYQELEARVSQLEKEYVAIKQMGERLVHNLEVEPESFLIENFHVERADRHDSKMSETKYGANNVNMVCLSSSRSKERSCGNEETPTSAKADHTPAERNDYSDRADCSSSTKSCNPLFRVKEEERCTSSEFDLGYRCSTAKELALKVECSNQKPCISKMDIEKPAVRVTIDISDSDDEAEITPKHTSKYGGDCDMVFTPLENAKKVATDDGEETTPQKRVTVNSSVCFPLAKRSRGLDTSKTTNMYLNCGDEIPVGKQKMKKLQDLTDETKNPMDSQVHKSFIASTIPLEDKNAKLGQPLSQLKHCKESNIRAEKSSNILVNDGTFSESGIPTSCDAGKLVSVNKTVNTGQDEDLDSDNSSDDTADAWGDGSAISQVFSLIKMNKQKNIRWKYESDMLSSLEEDPDLCLTAVCALYRQQGFSTFDVRRGNMLAEFLMGGTGNNAGGLKKSVKDLQMHNPKGLEQCKDLAMRHSSQLFNIYKKRRNPFFL